MGDSYIHHGSVSTTPKNIRLSFKMQSMIVLAMCVTVTLGDYVLPGIGIVGRYPARPPMRPIEDDLENETGRWQWIPPEEVGDDSDIEEIPDLIFPGNTEEIPEALPVVTGNNEEIPGDLSLFIGSSEEFPEALPLKGSTEEILEVLPLSSKRRRRYAATASSTEGRRRRAPTSSTEGRRRRSAASTSSTGGRRRRSAATSSSTKATERRRRREVTSTEECCDSKKYVCEVGQPLC